MNNNFFTGFLMAFCFIVFLIIASYLAYYSDEQKSVEIIKKTKNYSVYDNCYDLDEKYYCYNNENN